MKIMRPTDGRHKNKPTQGMDGTKLTRQRDGQIESYIVGMQITRPKIDGTKITRQRMENLMVCTKITGPRDRWMES